MQIRPSIPVRTARVRRRLCEVMCWLVLPIAGTATCQAGDAEPQTPPDDASSVPVPASTVAPPVQSLGEVTVTANRRRQPAREVPMHVDAVPAGDLQRRGASDLTDYVSTQPDVVFANSGGPGQGKLIMRGVTTGNQTTPTVSQYIDDVPVGGSTVYASSASFVFDPALMDLKNIEFLYGPQGTLYGAGSMGGLVKYVTRKPDTSRFYGHVGFGVSQTQHGGTNYNEKAMLNVPLKQDLLALRISLLDKHRAGVYQAVGKTPAHRDDRSHTKGARIQLQAYPTERLSFNLSAMAQKISADGLSMADYNLDGQPISGGPYNRQLNHREPFTQTLQLYAFHANYDLGWSSVDWTSAYQKFGNHGVLDYPDVFLGFLNQLGPAFGVHQKLRSLYVDSAYDVHKSTQEIRFVSHKNKTVDWLMGVWFTREDVWNNYALQGANLPPPQGTTRLLQQIVHARFDGYAGYGDVTWHMTPTVDLTVGIRGSGNKQVLSNFEDGPVAGSPGGFREHTNKGDLTGLVTAKYHPDKRHSYYFRAASGYRPGGLQAPVKSTIVGANPNARNTFNSDALQSYEVGYKSSDLDGRLNIGVDGYHIEWQDLQLYTYTLGNTIVENAGDARIDGLELKLDYRLGHWRFNGAGAYTHARTVQADPQAGIPKGAPLPYSARRTLTLGVEYEWQMGSNPAHAGANLHASSRRNAGFENDDSDPNFKLAGYGILNLNAGLTLGGGKGTSIDLFVRNALNRRVAMGTLNSETVNFLASVGGPMLVHLSQPRTVGVSVQVPF